MTHDTTSASAGRAGPRQLLLPACLAIALVCLIVLFLYLTIRIGRQGRAPAVPPAPSAPAPSEIYAYAVDELPALAAYLSADLDAGRLRAAPPIDWFVAPRDKQHLAQFVLDRTGQSPLPRIRIDARDAPFRQLRDVTRENLPEFLALFPATLDDATRGATAGRILMLRIGDVPCLRYTQNLEFRVGPRKYAGERGVLVTLRQGRLYTVTLDVYVGKLDVYNGDAFAVIAGLQFLPPAAPDPAAPDQEPPLAETPGAAGAAGADAAEADRSGSPAPAAR